MQPPTEQTLTLGGMTATVRDWSKVDLCGVPPQLFTGDLDSLSALLAEFLGRTSAGADGVWSQEQVALLEEGQQVLPGALELQQRALYFAGRAPCRFDGTQRAEELVNQGKRRLEQAPLILPRVKARLALLAWKDGQPMARTAAKEAGCAAPPKPPQKVTLFYAFEDEAGRTEWHFCDEGRVVAVPGALPAFQPSMPEPGKKAKKLKKPQVYLDEAAKFPGEQVNRAPKIPPPPREPEEPNILEPEPE